VEFTEKEYKWKLRTVNVSMDDRAAKSLGELSKLEIMDLSHNQGFEACECAMDTDEP